MRGNHGHSINICDPTSCVMVQLHRPRSKKICFESILEQCRVKVFVKWHPPECSPQINVPLTPENKKFSQIYGQFHDIPCLTIDSIFYWPILQLCPRFRDHRILRALGTRDKTINNLSTLAIASFGPVRAPPFLRTTANTSRLMNWELSDKYDLQCCEWDKRGTFIWSLLVNMAKTTPFKGTVSPRD